MKYNDLIDKLGKVVEESNLLLRIDCNVIAIEGKFFHESTINKIQRLLQLYSECEWWIYPSVTIVDGVMYTIKIFQYK